METAPVTSHGNSNQTEVILRSFMKKCPLGLIHNLPTGYKRHLYKKSITIPRDEVGSQFSTANVLQVGYLAGKPVRGIQTVHESVKIKQIETSQTWAVFLMSAPSEWNDFWVTHGTKLHQ